MKTSKRKKSTIWDKLNWFFWFIFFGIGVLNMIYISIVPGIIYILISLIYLPPFNRYLKTKYNFEFAPIIKIIIAILVLWFTLGVSDLFEMLERAMR